MKNQRKESDWDDALIALSDEAGKRKNRFSEKKARGKTPLVEPVEDEKPGVKPRTKHFQDTSMFEDEWDEDDQALFEWRRSGGSIAPVKATENTQNGDDNQQSS
jgi:hypothetical protein